MNGSNDARWQALPNAEQELIIVPPALCGVKLGCRQPGSSACVGSLGRWESFEPLGIIIQVKYTEQSSTGPTFFWVNHPDTLKSINKSSQGGKGRHSEPRAAVVLLESCLSLEVSPNGGISCSKGASQSEYRWGPTC